jgi:hypothetical protein
MGWLHNRNYVGPDRRSGRFEVRFRERRDRDAQTETRASLRGAIGQLFARGLKWVDTMSYFGPDRRTGAFSHFFLERRKREAVGAPPTLAGALRQLRMRTLEAETEDGRRSLQERLNATALLADAQGHSEIGDLLTRLAEALESGASDLSILVQSELLNAEAMLDAAAMRARGG